MTSETGGKVSITLPTGARSNFDPSTSIGTQAEVGDWVIITAVDQSVKLTKTANNGWENRQKQIGLRLMAIQQPFQLILRSSRMVQQ